MFTAVSGLSVATLFCAGVGGALSGLFSSTAAVFLFVLVAVAMALPNRRFKDATLPILRLQIPMWRLVEAGAWFYLALLLKLVLGTAAEGRSFVNGISSTMGAAQTVETDYAASCDFKYAYERIDLFVFAHALGWFGKALVIRDARLLWTMSIAFELTEVLLRPWLPNFHECWWDHLFYDVFTANAIGIHAGLWCADYLGLSVLDWGTTFWFKARSFPGVGVPSLRVPCWGQRWCFTCAVVVVLGTALDCNYFFLKYLLWIPHDHWVMWIRAFASCALAGAATEDLHDHAKTRSGLGVHGVLLGLIILAELAVAMKFTHEFLPEGDVRWLFNDETARNRLLAFALTGLVFVIYTFMLGKESGPSDAPPGSPARSGSPGKSSPAKSSSPPKSPTSPPASPPPPPKVPSPKPSPKAAPKVKKEAVKAKPKTRAKSPAKATRRAKSPTK